MSLHWCGDVAYVYHRQSWPFRCQHTLKIMTEDVLHLPIHCWIASTQKMRAGKAVIWHWVFDMSCVFVSVRESAQKCRKIPLIWLNRCRMSPAQEAFSTLFMGPTILISSGSGWMSAHILMSIRGWNHTSKCLLTIKCF